MDFIDAFNKWTLLILPHSSRNIYSPNRILLKAFEGISYFCHARSIQWRTYTEVETGLRRMLPSIESFNDLFSFFIF